MMPFESYPDPDQLERLRRANENAARRREERFAEAEAHRRHRKWVLIDTARQSLELARTIEVAEEERWKVQNVCVGLESLIEKLEDTSL